MHGLTILVATGDAERFHAALTYAAAAAAMGTATKLHLHEGAVALLTHFSAPKDEVRAAAGLPTLTEIWREALALGVQISVCQSGLVLAGLTMTDLHPSLEAQGPIGVLADDGNRIIVF